MTGTEIIAIMLILLYPMLVVSSMVILAWKNYKNDNSIRIEWDVVAKFIGFMALVTVLRFSWMDMAESLFPGSISDQLQPLLKHVGFAKLGLVFWEDVWFGMPIAWAWNKWGKSNTKLAITITLIISAIFASGHVYQGALGLITIVYPFFISYKYGAKHGFGTVMVCHMAYDFISLLTAKLFLIL